MNANLMQLALISLISIKHGNPDSRGLHSVIWYHPKYTICLWLLEEMTLTWYDMKPRTVREYTNPDFLEMVALFTE